MSHTSDSLRLVDGWDVANVAAAIVQPGAPLRSHGDIHRCFELASVTKLLSAYAVLISVEEGTATLDAPAGPHGSTIAHLLSHSSGLGPDDREHPLAPPETHRIYSNAGFEVLGDVVASKASIRFGAYVEESVIQPLDLGDTKFGLSPARDASSSVADLVRFVEELFSPTLLDRSTIDRATSVAFPGLAGVVPGFGRFEHCDWGLGFELKGAKYPHWTAAGNSPGTFGHFGQSGTFLWIDPLLGVGLVVLTDRPFGDWARSAWPELSQAVVAEFAAGGG